MIIATSQDVAAVGCCECQTPACGDPRKECQSITIDACGFTLPAPSGLAIPAEDQCRLWRSYDGSYEYKSDYAYPPESSTAHNYESFTFGMEVSYSGTSCATRISESSRSFDSAAIRAGYYNWEELYVCSGDWDTPCSGTHTYTDHLDSGNDISEDWVDCPTSWEASFTVEGGYSYVSPGQFSYSWSHSDSETTETIEAVLTYLPFDVEYMKSIFDGLSFPGDANGSECSSSTEFDPDCPIQPVTMTKARYRLGVPAGFSTETFPRTTYEVQWDEIFFPDGWDRMIDDPDYEPPAEEPEGGWPPVPQIPDPDRPNPSLVASKEWIWGGSMDGEDQFSEWYEIPIPDTAGETKLMNMLVICYRSSRVGQKPTAFGDQYIIPEEP